MRQVLLIGGNRDGDRVQVRDDCTDVVFLPARLTHQELFGGPEHPAQQLSKAHVYKLERFQAGRAVMWVGYPPDTHPEHGLAMLMAGYVGNQHDS